MSQSYEDFIQLICVRCEDVGLDCGCNIYGISKKTVIDNTIIHMHEYHAISPEEMTTDMKLKILENIHVHYPPPLTGPSFYNSHFCQGIQ